jgi:hypothetical protein
MRHDVAAVWGPWQKELLDNQAGIERRALELYRDDPDRARAFLTEYAMEWGDKVVERCWEIGDFLWTKYDEKF